MMRLDKFLSVTGKASRSQSREYLKKGQVTVNGEVVKKPETKIEEERDSVCLCGERIEYAQFVYYMLNKPGGVVSATEDAFARTVVSMITENTRKDIFPVGRLDKDTEGLLLITNNGELAHRLLAPRKHVDKTYYAELEKSVDEADILAFKEGIDIGEDKLTLPAVLEAAGEARALVTIREGKFHQIKRMFEARDNHVVFLKRLSMGPLKLDESLSPGEYRRLTQPEIESLFVLTGLKGQAET